VAASDLQVRLDVARLIAELALLVGPDASADLALEKTGAAQLVAVAPLQPVVLARSTRAALRRRKDILPALRQRLLAVVPGDEITYVRLERIQLRTLMTVVAGVAAVYLLAGELGRGSLTTVLRSADWRWASRRSAYRC
jgi:glycosyltransferase 2 family protein